jgi:O-antigen/teichoic acid export membrane protein
MSTTPLPLHATTAAPPGYWRGVLRDSLLVSLAAAVAQALGVVTSLLLRWLLPPAHMGIWQGLKLLLSYGNYCNLGASKAAARQVGLARGDGLRHLAQHAVNVAHTVNTLASALYAAALLAAGAWLWMAGSGPYARLWAAGLLAVAALTWLQRYVTFLVTIRRAEQDFRLTALLNVQEAVLTLLLGAALTWLWGLPGLYVATAAVLVASLVSLRYARRSGICAMVHRHSESIVPRWAWDLAEARRLVAIGAPILLAGVVSSLFRSIDKIMLLAYLPDGEFQLGCYSLALLVAAQLYGLANMLSLVMGPRYAEALGRTGSPRHVARLAARACELQAALLSLPAGLALACGAAVLGWLLPEYRAGLEALGPLVPGAVALGVSLPCSGYLVAAARGRAALLIVGAATVLAAAANHVALRGGWGLRGVAVASAAADVAYLLLLAACSIGPLLTARDRWRLLMVPLGLLVPVLGLGAYLGRALSACAASPMSVAAAAAAVVALWGVLMLAGWRSGLWREARATDA